MRSKRTILHLLFFLLASAPLLAQEEQDEIPADLPEGTVFNDSLEVVVDSTQMEVGIVDTKIHLLSRTYGDSIVLRWAPEDYATWRYVNRVGMDVLRYSEDRPFDADTLAHCLRPYTLEQFRQRYPTTDTLAMTAAGLLYDENRTRPTATKNPPGSLGSLYEIYQEQQMRYAFALLTTEWRRDLADALAMRLVDKTAKRGKTYEYIVRPSEIDTTGQMIVRTGHIPELKNERYKPEAFTTTLTDTTIAENSVQLTWNRGRYSTFEVERRGPLSPSGAPLPPSTSSLSPASPASASPSGTPASPSTSKATVPDGSPSGNWTRVTPKPYIDMSPNTQGQPDTLYTMTDQVPQVGLYDYRLLAHDAFGDLTEPTKPFRVWVRDITPPSPPAITLITIDRRDSTDLSKGVFATFHLRKDTMEADYTGWHLVYYHEKDTEKQWRRLSPQQTPADTLLTLDVTGISTGMVAVAASDTANNTSYSIATMLRLEDLKAPGVPQNLRAQGNPLQGTITLDWDAPEDLDIDYYEVAYANDSTHRWVLATEQKLHDTHFVDTIDVTANQKYIYYKVRAIDYSTNEGFYSPVLQVIRPTLIPPVVAHIDSTWVDDNGIHMRWITSAEHFVSHHLVWRRLHTDKEWTLLAVCNADSLADYDYELTLHDKPEYNREARYDYAIETISYSGVSSEKSLAYSVRWEGDAVFSLPLKLYGEYLEDKQETRLVWEMPQEPPYKGRWYFCIFRQGPDDKAPTFLISAAKDDRIFSDHLLDPGQQASYFIRVKYADGRQSEDSNTVTVKRPTSTSTQ
ncbi:MAG: fibronectin type III domain-containing protein [Bacteroidaceae bacterium]|nr:fibronectin type III domain-containing protein [Bacteroidaceae bacterium]